MKLSQQVNNELSRLRFFSAKNQHTFLPCIKQAADIIAKCKELLTLVPEQDVRDTLYALIEQTTGILATQSEKENANKLAAVHRLRLEVLKLPAHFPAENNLAHTSYRIAVACFYLLVISICLTIGAAFGAWYFGFLTATYFYRYFSWSAVSNWYPSSLFRIGFIWII